MNKYSGPLVCGLILPAALFGVWYAWAVPAGLECQAEFDEAMDGPNSGLGFEIRSHAERLRFDNDYVGAENYVRESKEQIAAKVRFNNPSCASHEGADYTFNERR